MSLFDQILGAVNNPQQQASTDQLGSILGVAEQLAGNNGIDPGMTQAAMSVLGGYVRSSLQDKQANEGSEQAQSIVNQFAGLGSNPQAVQALFSGSQQQQIINDIAQRTGLNSGMIQSMLPVLVPLALNLLQSGRSTQNAQGGNPVLNAFLDGDRDGDVDIGDVMGMAGQFLSQRR
jgi:hypothetical protein